MGREVTQSQSIYTAGHDAPIFERSTGELQSRGAGIVAQPNVSRFLDRYERLSTTLADRSVVARREAGCT